MRTPRFSMFENDWAFPIVDGKNGDAGLVYGTVALLFAERTRRVLCDFVFPEISLALLYLFLRSSWVWFHTFSVFLGWSNPLEVVSPSDLFFILYVDSVDTLGSIPKLRSLCSKRYDQEHKLSFHGWMGRRYFTMTQVNQSSSKNHVHIYAIVFEPLWSILINHWASFCFQFHYNMFWSVCSPKRHACHSIIGKLLVHWLAIVFPSKAFLLQKHTPPNTSDTCSRPQRITLMPESAN